MFVIRTLQELFCNTSLYNKDELLCGFCVGQSTTPMLILESHAHTVENVFI